MYKIYRDSPKENASHFNFDIYADSLSKIILNNENETPFTISVNGKWGSGKTTLMRTLKKQLDTSTPTEHQRKVKTVWFDAWKYSECESMFAALICEILEEMERKKLLDKLKSKILIGSKKIDVLKQLSDLAKVLTLGNGPEFEKWVKNTEYEEKLSFYDIFQDYMKLILQTFVLEKTDDIYTDEKGVLVIFIDDLDRCPPNNITAVLESINLFLDQEGCFFVIGTDISIIAKSIEAKYKDVEDFSGIEYIKKIIQLKFDLPLLKENDIEKFMRNELRVDSKLDGYLDIIVKGLKNNQREIIRFLNTINLMRILGSSLESKDTSSEDKFVYNEELLIKWNILDFSSPDFIDEIKTKNEVLFDIQAIARISDRKRDERIQSLKKDGKEKYYSYCQNKKIIAVLSSGKEEFNDGNIETYLFLSSITPKDIDEELHKKTETNISLAEKVSSIYAIAPGTVYEGDTTYAGADLHDIIGLDDEKYIEMNATNFTGFISQEKLKIYGGSFVDYRTIKKRGLVYETQIEQMDFKSDAWKDTYSIMELFGYVYVPLKNNTPDKLTKLLINSGDKYTLRLGSALELASGYELTAKQIDVSGDRVWMELSKNGEFIEDKVIHVDDKTDGTWIYDTDIADEVNVEVFRVNVTNLFQGQVDSLVVVEGIWLIDYENILEIEIDDEFEILKVDRIVDKSIIMVNEETILLKRNSIQEIAEGMKLKVTDSDNLEFKLIREYV
ncbi:S-layer protein domain-containing protein [uncultured Methanolobus sp.]|uniref:S-layer protein domain-containing protein n=1 Tax=uncultured Methanolobus sp. TaxID=218300 RepID=UPI002AABA176|nr:S-layer protein domain-containing protein [uncultured Methanolobus sp.]